MRGASAHSIECRSATVWNIEPNDRVEPPPVCIFPIEIWIGFSILNGISL